MENTIRGPEYWEGVTRFMKSLCELYKAIDEVNKVAPHDPVLSLLLTSTTAVLMRKTSEIDKP